MVEEVVLGGEVSPVTEARWLLREALAGACPVMIVPRPADAAA